MFRTSLKIISTVLAAAAIAVPVASAGSNPTTPSVGQGFSLGVPLEYLNTGAPTHATEGFSLGVPTEYLAQSSAPTHATEGFSLGVPTEYLAQGSAPTHVSQGFSLGVPTEYLARDSAPTHVSQGFSLGVPTEYLAPASSDASASFDWSAAAIGAGIVAGLFLMIAGIGAMTIRARKGQRAGRLSAT